MSRELLPYDLAWSDVDPRTHPFDPAAALDVVRGLDAASRVPVRPFGRRSSDPDERREEYARLCSWSHTEGWDWARAMTADLIARYGPWSTGWRWAHDEGDLGGGPVGLWCCTLHSIGTPEETLERVAGALCEWREWLEYLARRFDAYPLDAPDAEDRRDTWERATHHLILQVLDRTGSGDAWYGHCRQVLTWFLTRWDVDRRTADALVEEAIGGRFASWTAPEGKLVHEVAEQLATSLEPDAEPPAAVERYRYTSAHLQSYLDE
ncbi:hypothetical protein [Streptomyces sp. S.PB5]|uniref:hypothetical protein n=1 Tax=Streptomyces sp. S.PB5 TaxID=3020844 RepID=UPI0025B05E2C|nr:hypothetical protein [Streptomyces sp. S.PB5]MDN3020549.1 hypothetical protein [Streptomyces sp. S.PB5]